MKPFVRVSISPESLAKQASKMLRAGIAQATIDELQQRSLREVIWKNDRYQVNVGPAPVPEGWPALLHLSIKRIDRNVIRDWRELQEIKNRILSPEHEAVELYPAESRLCDGANQYHLFALADAKDRWPFGYNFGREVWDGRICPTTGARQRPFKKEQAA